MTTAGADIDVVRLAGRIGAEVRGLRLAEDLDEASVALLRDAVLRYKVVFLREQPLDDAAHMRVASRFGIVPDIGHPYLLDGKNVQPSVLRVTTLDEGLKVRTDHWHADMTIALRPSSLEFLRPVVLPPFGGDTIWANTAAAYQDLPEPLARLADALWAVHGSLVGYGRPGGEFPAVPENGEVVAAYGRQPFETVHPVVAVHPETGERCLLLGSHARHLVGMKAVPSMDLIRLFEDYITRPENTVRWTWRLGDLAIYDNRSTQHYGVTDYGDLDRELRRVALLGEVPVGVDGRPSTVRLGDDSVFST